MSALTNKIVKTHAPVDVEALLRDKFEELMKEEKLHDLEKEDREAIIRCMKVANKIGYTNGFKKGSMKAR